VLNFVYNVPTKVFFGKDQELKIGQILKDYGINRVLLHYGKDSIKKSGLYDKIVAKLKENDIFFIELGGVHANPELDLVLKGVKLCKENNIELVLAVGGGSVIDSSKAIALGAKVDFSPWKFSIKEETPKDRIFVGTILTISAAGSDMSDSCVITNTDTGEKRGFSSDFNRPLFSILNPELTYSVSKYQTACGIVDIMMHTLERYISLGEPTEITDNIAIGLLKTVYDYGKIAIEDPKNYDARANLMWANSLSHNSLTGLGRKYFMSVHQMEHELSGMYTDIAHGAGLAVLWPGWAMKVYKAAPERFLRLSYEVIGIKPSNDKNKDIEDGIKAIRKFFNEIGMPDTLRQLNVKEDTLKELAWNAMFKGKRTLDDIVCVDYDLALEILRSVY